MASVSRGRACSRAPVEKASRGAVASLPGSGDGARAVLSTTSFSPKTPLVSIVPLLFVLGVTAVKEGLEDYLEEIKYDELTETESDSLVLSGTGKGKESGVDLVFTSAVFESGPERFAGIVFIVDADIEKYYEKTVLAICQSVLVEADFADEEAEEQAADTN